MDLQMFQTRKFVNHLKLNILQFSKKREHLLVILYVNMDRFSIQIEIILFNQKNDNHLIIISPQSNSYEILCVDCIYYPFTWYLTPICKYDFRSLKQTAQGVFNYIKQNQLNYDFYHIDKDKFIEIHPGFMNFCDIELQSFTSIKEARFYLLKLECIIIILITINVLLLVSLASVMLNQIIFNVNLIWMIILYIMENVFVVEISVLFAKYTIQKKVQVIQDVKNVNSEKERDFLQMIQSTFYHLMEQISLKIQKFHHDFQVCQLISRLTILISIFHQKMIDIILLKYVEDIILIMKINTCLQQPDQPDYQCFLLYAELHSNFTFIDDNLINKMNVNFEKEIQNQVISIAFNPQYIGYLCYITTIFKDKSLISRDQSNYESSRQKIGKFNQQCPGFIENCQSCLREKVTMQQQSIFVQLVKMDIMLTEYQVNAFNAHQNYSFFLIFYLFER
ncbi:unnamed protein product [Paramecium pentaurelia]|uniref:Transmembrane protein n=1 Tax=Paramecium pentaurelia TaxID=43138 RepID=A0A8S1VXT2_9CILI|nr:unnamed protein product [Paramecium pentaurelia]